MRSIDAIMAEGRARSRPRKHDEPASAVEITFQTSTCVVAMLDELARSGLYPADRGAVAEELLRAKLREIERARLGAEKTKARE